MTAIKATAIRIIKSVMAIVSRRKIVKMTKTELWTIGCLPTCFGLFNRVHRMERTHTFYTKAFHALACRMHALQSIVCQLLMSSLIIFAQQKKERNKFGPKRYSVITSVGSEHKTKWQRVFFVCLTNYFLLQSHNI